MKSAEAFSTTELAAFLLEAKRQGYAGGNAKRWVKQPDQSTTIAFESGPWRMDDNFFGGEPYGGREVVFHEDHPVWMMVYYGWAAPDADPSVVYATLREALKRMPADHPFRGPREYQEGRLTYRNRWEGDLARFVGREDIVDNGATVYEANYAGGWTDRRHGD